YCDPRDLHSFPTRRSSDLNAYKQKEKEVNTMDQQLLVFVTVVEKQNFTRAAEYLHMTQPAVSQYIQTLERHVGTKLLNRSNKYVDRKSTRLNSSHVKISYA